MIIRTIDTLLEGKSLISISSAASVREACKLLNIHNVGAVAVIDDGKLSGIMSERDVIRRCLDTPGALDAMRVADIMTADPVTIRRGASLVDAMTLMRDGGFRHLPVVDEEDLPVGMVSLRDIPTQYRVMAERYQEYLGGSLSA